MEEIRSLCVTAVQLRPGGELHITLALADRGHPTDRHTVVRDVQGPDWDPELTGWARAVLGGLGEAF